MGKIYMKALQIITLSAIILFLIISSVGTGLSSKLEWNDTLDLDIITFDFIFNKPLIQTNEWDDTTVHSILIDDLPISTDFNKPMLPVKPLKILLPYGKTVKEISIELHQSPIIYENIYPENGPLLAPIGNKTNYNDPISQKNKNITCIWSYQGIHHFCGFPILFLNIHPLTYHADTNDLIFYPKITLHIQTIECQPSEALRYSENDILYLKNMVENPSYIQSYPHQLIPQTADDASYIIITSEQLKNSELEINFQTLIYSKISKGINARIVTVEEILANPAYSVNGSWGDNNPLNPFYQHSISSNYSRFNDVAARIRNFIRYAYMRLGSKYILLGGDGDVHDEDENIIPGRGLFANESGLPLISFPAAISEEQDDIPSDVYYACLDGSYNYDMDDHFGESPDRNDLIEQDEADLIAEVYVGRAPVDSEHEVANFVYKTLSYEHTKHPYISNILLVGEYLGFPGISAYGGNYKDLVKPYIPDTYQINTLYDRDLSTHWIKQDIIKIINNATPHIINHDGHAYYGYDLKMYNSDIDYLNNYNTFFLYSHGCMAGGFDNPDGYDCIAERLTVETPHGAFAAIMNARYGLGSENSLDSPSNALDISLFQAFFTENIRELGRANHYSKEDHIWHINDNGIRWVFYETNLFGDPELQIKDSDPTPIEITVELTRPEQNCIFINDKSIFSLFFLKNPIIFGGITIQADAQSEPQGNVHSVEFFINNKSYYIDYKEPFTWHLQIPLKGTYDLSVIAHGYYAETAKANQIIKIWIPS
jgi:peptidase C25-like protein/Big-like domain-containing protein